MGPDPGLGMMTHELILELFRDGDSTTFANT